MNLGFDLDGVCYPWHSQAYSYLKLYHGITKTYLEFWREYTKYEELLKYVVTLPDLYEKGIPSKEVLDTLNKLDSEGHTIYYITTRPEEVTRITENFLARYNFPQDFNLVITKDKDKYARLFKLDLFVDDRIHVVEKLKTLCTVLLMNQPWNEEVEGFTRIYNFKEILNYVKK